MNKKKIMITGNRGFLGSALQSYLSKDYVVYGVDLQDGTDIFNMPNLWGINTLIHCAAFTSVEDSRIKAPLYYRTNVLGTAYIVNECIKHATQFYYISSAAINDFESSPYADSKSLAHDIADVFLEELQGVIFIPFNIYSDKPKEGSLFQKFRSEKQYTINGNGNQTRDFIHIQDVCDIIKTALDEEWQTEILELGTGKGTRINQIAKLFKKHINKPIVYSKRDYGIKNSVANTDHLREHYKKPFKTNLIKDIEKICLGVN